MSFAASPPPRRLLAVHAHPDDEALYNGATLARYAAEGTQVTVVTCTQGEEGEVLLPELEPLTSTRGDQLGGYRVGELAAAMTALGVDDHRWLGGSGHYRDSGMVGTGSTAHPASFHRADPDEAAGHLVAVVREVRPQVVLTYDDNGGYGHPDHIKAQQTTHRAVELAADPGFRPELGRPWRADRLFWSVVPDSVHRAGLTAAAQAAAALGLTAPDPAHTLVRPVADDRVSVAVPGARHAAAKHAAMAAYRSQLFFSADPGWYALTNQVAQRFEADEYYLLAAGTPLPATPATDLFDGLSDGPR